MKIRFQFILLAFLVSATANAQNFNFGVKAGTNINKISGESFSQQFTYSYHAGVFAEIGFGEKFSLQPEVIFNQISSDTSNKFSSTYTNFSKNASTIKLTYLSIPILLDYKLSKFFRLQAGPQYGILINHNENLVDNGKDALKKGDFSMLAGVQLKIGSFRIYGRYAIGLSNINDISNEDKWKSQSIQLGIGFTFL